MGTQVRWWQEGRLLSRLRAGDPKACEEFVRTYYGAVYRFLLHLGGGTHQAEDLTQEVFASAWAGLAGFEGRGSLGTWLHRIAYGKFIDAVRRLKRDAAVVERLQQRGADQPNGRALLDQLVAEERARSLYGAVRQLDQPEQVVIVLHYLQGLSFREMAGVLDEPVGTVKWRTSQALRRLKALLNGKV